MAKPHNGVWEKKLIENIAQLLVNYKTDRDNLSDYRLRTCSHRHKKFN